jgi:hypothetical protein
MLFVDSIHISVSYTQNFLNYIFRGESEIGKLNDLKIGKFRKLLQIARKAKGCLGDTLPNCRFMSNHFEKLFHFGSLHRLIANVKALGR